MLHKYTWDKIPCGRETLMGPLALARVGSRNGGSMVSGQVFLSETEAGSGYYHVCESQDKRVKAGF